jgi:hypothetical protein
VILQIPEPAFPTGVVLIDLYYSNWSLPHTRKQPPTKVFASGSVPKDNHFHLKFSQDPEDQRQQFSGSFNSFL